MRLNTGCLPDANATSPVGLMNMNELAAVISAGAGVSLQPRRLFHNQSLYSPKDVDSLPEMSDSFYITFKQSKSEVRGITIP